MTMAMELIRHIAGLYSGKAIKGDITQIYITGNEIWMAQQILASQQEEGAQGDLDEYAEFESWLEREKPAGCVGDMERGWMARATLAQPSPLYDPKRCLACGGDHGNSGLPCPNMRVTAQAQPSPAPELDFAKPLETASGEPVKWICSDVIEYKSARVCVDQNTGLVYSSPYIGLKIRNVMPAPELERPEVVAYVGCSARMTSDGWENGPEYLVFAMEASDADKRYDVPLMTVAQHAGIVAKLASPFNRAQDRADAAQARVVELLAALERAAAAMWNSEANMDIAAADAEEAIGNAKSGAPVAQAGQVPEGCLLVTTDQVERHSTTAWECPPQSRVVLLSTLQRLTKKNMTEAPQPTKGE